MLLFNQLKFFLEYLRYSARIIRRRLFKRTFIWIILPSQGIIFLLLGFMMITIWPITFFSWWLFILEIHPTPLRSVEPLIRLFFYKLSWFRDLFMNIINITIIRYFLNWRHSIKTNLFHIITITTTNLIRIRRHHQFTFNHIFAFNYKAVIISIQLFNNRNNRNYF